MWMCKGLTPRSLPRIMRQKGFRRVLCHFSHSAAVTPGPNVRIVHELAKCSGLENFGFGGQRYILLVGERGLPRWMGTWSCAVRFLFHEHSQSGAMCPDAGRLKQCELCHCADWSPSWAGSSVRPTGLSIVWSPSPQYSKELPFCLLQSWCGDLCGPQLRPWLRRHFGCHQQLLDWNVHGCRMRNRQHMRCQRHHALAVPWSWWSHGKWRDVHTK